MVLILACAAAALAGCSKSSGRGSSGDSSVVEDPPTIVPGPGQAFLTGDVSRLVAEDALVVEPLSSPFTISASERGTGNATIENALVGGKRTTISWGTGTPLPITGSGGLDLGPVRVEVDPRGLTLGLDGAARPFRPGTYRAAASVAVGSAGIAASRDGVDFTADARTVLTTRGGVVIRRDPRRVELEGPGKVTVAGRLQVQTPDSKRPAVNVTFGPGPFKVTLVPLGDRVSIDGVLQGQVTAT